MKTKTHSQHLAPAGLTLALLAIGCTRFASEDDGYPTTELAASEAAATTDYSCVAQEAGNPIMPGAGAPLEYSVLALDFISGRTPANMLVRGCYRGDLPCSRPATERFSPGADGRVRLPLTEGFNGYLEITSDDMVPTLLVFPTALTPELASVLESITVAMLPPEMLSAFAEASQLDLDPSAGVLSVNTFDCAGPYAPGVRLELNAPAVPFMFVDGLPLAYRDTTTDEGSGGFANVLPGLVVVRGFEAETMREVGLETVPVRSQWVTVASLMPQFAGTP